VELPLPLLKLDVRQCPTSTQDEFPLASLKLDFRHVHLSWELVMGVFLSPRAVSL
jgi:hypothetical protein